MQSISQFVSLITWKHDMYKLLQREKKTLYFVHSMQAQNNDYFSKQH